MNNSIDETKLLDDMQKSYVRLHDIGCGVNVLHRLSYLLAVSMVSIVFFICCAATLLLWPINWLLFGDVNKCSVINAHESVDNFIVNRYKNLVANVMKSGQ